MLASVAVSLEDEVDPIPVVCASRAKKEEEPWFCFEQPARGVTVAGLGAVAELTAAGAGRFERVAERWRELAGEAVCDPAEEPLAVGGFAFAPEGGGAPHWEGFAPASLVVPEVAFTRGPSSTGQGRAVRMRLAAMAAPDDLAEDLVARVQRRVASLRSAPLGLLDPAPSGRYRVVSAMPPEHYEHAVARAVHVIAEGELEKVVLAREVQVHAPAPYEIPPLLGILREQFPSCFVLCVGRGDGAFLAASPELLVRREGQRVSTLALAGSMRRSADPAVDDHLGEQLLRDPGYRAEQAIVARRIERMLRPRSVWVAAAPEPELVRIANIQHLATPIRAQLAHPVDTLDLLALMHPTPAVGGEPFERAAPLIPALEGFDRGWYSGPVGWTDGSGDGEFAVALRCALLRGSVARCFAGNGIVGTSQPDQELAETEVKLAALLPLLSG